ncbi:hypothetical protein PS2_017771 [Malus domestica]
MVKVEKRWRAIRIGFEARINKTYDRVKQSSLIPERTGTKNADCDEPNVNISLFQRSASVVLSRGKDVCLDNTNSAIGKKSPSFLLTKVFVEVDLHQPLLLLV